MEAAQVSIQTGALQARLQMLAESLRRPTQANREVSIALYAWTLRNYDSEGGLVGGWRPLRPRTVRRKERLGKQRMLVMTGAMRNSILPFHDDTDAGVGTPMRSIRGAPYPKFHQEGTERFPARPFLPDRRTALEIGIEIYKRHVGLKVRGT